MASAGPTLTLQDIADLARVRRPVVSMWRKRPRIRGELIPFPAPVQTVGNLERFSRDDVVDWLERTGRGKNSEARLDAPALSAPDGQDVDDLVTLLCLAATSGEELAETTAEERETLARGVDPGDQFMLREVIAMNPPQDTLRFVDDLVEASFGPEEALGRLEQGRLTRALAARDLTSDAIDLVRAVAGECAVHLDPEGAPLVHAGLGAALTLALADGFTHLVVAGDDPSHRALWRRATLRGIEVTTTTMSPNIRLLSVVGVDTDHALEEIDNVILDLGAGELAVVLGPASLLCDELRGEQEQNRAQTMRSGNLVTALRLPRGFWQEAHRQALGVWVCAGNKSVQRPLVADLAAFTEDEFDLGDLAADVTGALEAEGARAYRYLRPHDLPQILSSRTAVVPRGMRAVQLATTDVQRHLTRISAATLVTSEPIPTFDVLAEEAAGSMLVRRRSLGELKELGLLQVKRGSRFVADHADTNGSVAVLSAGRGGAMFTLDPLDVIRLYPRAARTEPGDVVFTEGPAPRAFVDDRGGSLVASPSKILRLDRKAGVGPHAVAAIINQTRRETNEWQTWNVPILEAAEAEQLEEALTAAAVHEQSLRKHMDAVHDLITSMIDGVAAGAVTLKTPTDE